MATTVPLDVGLRNTNGADVWSKLPVEIVVRILHHVSVADVISFSMVSQRFQDVVRHSVTLQYQILCHVSRVIDGGSQAYGLADRLKRLRAWTQKCSTLHDMEFTVIGVLVDQRAAPRPSCLFYNSGRGLSHLIAEGRSVAVHQLPSIIRGVPFRSWTCGGLSFEAALVCHDPTQNLLVVLETRPNDLGQDAILHFLHDMTGKAHCLAAADRAELHAAWPLGHRENGGDEIRICGSSVSLLMHGEDIVDLDGMVVVCVWNWRAGILIQVIVDCHMCDAAFLDQHHLLLPTRHPQTSELVLAVLDLNECQQGQYSSLQKLLRDGVSVLFQIPESPFLRATLPRVTVTGRGRSSSATPPPADVPFRTKSAVTAFMLIVEPSITTLTPGLKVATFAVAFPASTIYSLLQSPSGLHLTQPAASSHRSIVTVPWSLWGPHTRVFSLSPPFRLLDVCDSRIAIAEPSSADKDKSAVVVYDFAARRRALDLHVQQDSSTTMSSMIPENVPLPPQRDVLPAAPCRSVVSELVVRDGEQVGLYEDGLFVYRDDPDEAVKRIHVHSF